MNFDEVEAAFRAMGLEPGAALEEVKAAYKFSLQAYHPDKFPPESSAQKMATEKLIVIKDANELICKFYLEHPEGVPPGGWRTKKAEGQSAAPQDSAESTDWTQWEKGQSAKTESELGAWEKREAERQQTVKSGRAYEQRQKFVSYAKVALVIAIISLWCGKMANNAATTLSRKQATAAWMDRAMYLRQTGNVATGYRMTEQEAEAQAKREAGGLMEQWQEQDRQRWLGGFVLLLLTIGTVWLFVSKRAKAMIEKWVEGAGK
ncbi:MAG: J domain-containing protein [Candidatus Obscuribacter sp.]|jgi:curved DNA-binding protein CbpA|nr:J domain-containing protein [Candidatus Obscuribacter sp.]